MRSKPPSTQRSPARSGRCKRQVSRDKVTTGAAPQEPRREQGPRFTDTARAERDAAATKNSRRKGPEMFGDIARFLLNTVFPLFGAALLLRAWMQVVRMPPYNPVSNAVMQATNWLILPLRKILPAAKTIDLASIVGGFFAALVFV